MAVTENATVVWKGWVAMMSGLLSIGLLSWSQCGLVRSFRWPHWDCSGSTVYVTYICVLSVCLKVIDCDATLHIGSVLKATSRVQAVVVELLEVGGTAIARITTWTARTQPTDWLKVGMAGSHWNLSRWRSDQRIKTSVSHVRPYKDMMTSTLWWWW